MSDLETFKELICGMADAKSTAELWIKQARFMQWCGDNPDKLANLIAHPVAEPASLGAEADVAETAQHVYITDKEAMICGIPERRAYQDENTAHNCDAMGCSTLEHILRRVPFTDERKHQPIKAGDSGAEE